MPTTRILFQPTETIAERHERMRCARERIRRNRQVVAQITIETPSGDLPWTENDADLLEAGSVLITTVFLFATRLQFPQPSLN